MPGNFIFQAAGLFRRPFRRALAAFSAALWLLSMASNMAAAGMGDSCEISNYLATASLAHSRLRLFLLFDLKELEASTAVVLDQGSWALGEQFVATSRDAFAQQS